ncbi:probable serine/threonine-protein kinase DDB_G0281745 [Lytechinus variegatus]|uniref:probable serine/threonine-protein kinase DDB_G0281745 n=1 Tax=Lytechinus variegatus TaxID=7654 RepID=UPI001BB21100|nr:probable serine/threonine-protein kinase DDB_G0281745 [Lytechinus variegatus]
MQCDLAKKSATISLLEAKLTLMADRMEQLQQSERMEKDRVERQKASRRELQNNIKLLKLDNTRKETLIQRLRDLVEILKTNCLRKKRGGFRYKVRNTVDHAAIASMPNIRCDVLDVEDILPFTGYKLPGDLGDMRILGKGTYGMVYLGRYAKDGQNIAIKKPTLPSSYCGDLVKEERHLMKGRAVKESLLQQLLSGSTYFPKILGMVTIDEDMCTVMDFIGDRATGKTYPLYQALTRFMPNPRLDVSNLFKVCQDIIKGIMELHERGFLHNDLKSNNVLLEKRSQRWHAVIIDLGLVSTIAYANQKRFSEEKKAEYRAGKGCYFLAPEVVLYGERYSVASDIFSFGVLLKSIAKKIEVEEVQVLADSCSKQDPLERPQSMEEILHQMEAITACY